MREKENEIERMRNSQSFVRQTSQSFSNTKLHFRAPVMLAQNTVCLLTKCCKCMWSSVCVCVYIYIYIQYIYIYIKTV